MQRLVCALALFACADAWVTAPAAGARSSTALHATKVGKRMQASSAVRNSATYYKLDDALNLVKQTASAKFDESVDVAINLGIDGKRSDQNVRGLHVLPKGTGKTVRVAVFAEDGPDSEAREAGADLVGLDDLADTVAKGEIDFDVCIATPAAMKVIVTKLGRILGPRGLMPNAKVGTVTTDLTAAIKAAKGGQVQFRADKAGVVHVPIGKASFEAEGLKENLLSLVAALGAAKPSGAKGTYLKTCSVSTTMGPGIKLDVSSLPKTK